MADAVCVNVTGPALALLLYENVKSADVQEGFLLGEVTEVVTRTVTDADSHNVNLKKVINITAAIPCPQTCLFYNGVGQVNRVSLRDILGDQEKHMVAWYKYGRNAKFRLSLRDKIIHKELSTCLAAPHGLFACCVLSSSASSGQSTRTYSHSFLRYEGGRFKPLPLHIDNLGENCNVYKASVPASRMFLKIYNSMGMDKDHVADWDVVGHIQDALHKEISKSVVQLTRSEQKLAQLEREVDLLRLSVQARRWQCRERELERAHLAVDQLRDAVAADAGRKRDVTVHNKPDLVIDLTGEDEAPAAGCSRPAPLSYAQAAGHRAHSS